VRAAPQAAVLVDEAYWEFCGRTIAGEIGSLPNLFVARTFSKAYGLAGVRVGALLASGEQLAMVRKVASPYNVNAVALACLQPALEDEGHLQRYVAEVRRGRALLLAAFRAHDIRCWPSQGNFVLAQIGAHARAFVAAMSDRGILVRDRSDDPFCAGCVRVTVGTTAQMRRALAALDDGLREIGISRRSSS
jgi:histidinol-phosphate aminotransferase